MQSGPHSALRGGRVTLCSLLFAARARWGSPRHPPRPPSQRVLALAARLRGVMRTRLRVVLSTYSARTSTGVGRGGGILAPSAGRETLPTHRATVVEPQQPTRADARAAQQWHELRFSRNCDSQRYTERLHMELQLQKTYRRILNS